MIIFAIVITGVEAVSKTRASFEKFQEIDSPWLAVVLISDHDHLLAYCVRCERSFPNNRALEQYKEDSDAH
jgi:hypothetical protein